MDTQNQVVPASQPGFAQRLQHSKALVAIVAVLGVTVMALAAALVVNRSDAQPGVSAYAPANEPAKTAKLAADSAKPQAAKPHTTPTVVAQASPRANVCAACGTVEAVTPVQRQGKVMALTSVTPPLAWAPSPAAWSAACWATRWAAATARRP